MQLSEAGVEHLTGHFREPVVDCAKHNQNRRHAHHHMEMRDHKIGVRQRQINHHIAQEQAGQSAMDEGKNKADGKTAWAP